MNKLQTQFRDALGLLIIGAERAGLSENEIKEVIEQSILAEFELMPNDLEPIDATFEDFTAEQSPVNTLI